MLDTLSIRHFAIIEQAQIEFEPGMTALTGETGAGKSILLDAIGLVLGDRADADSVKSGADKADISVSFDITRHRPAQDWLREQELDQNGDCLLRRVVQASGRSKAFINGTPVTLAQLRELGELLVDLHGQHEHQSLQKPAIQRALLDSAGAHQSLLERVARAHEDWKQALQRLDAARDQSTEKQQRIDLLKLYVREFDELDLKPGEADELNSEYRRLSHAGQILQTSAELIDRLYEQEPRNLQTDLSWCVNALDDLCTVDPALKGCQELLSGALIQVEEAATELRAHVDGIDLDPSRLDWLNQRLSQIQGLARKHRVDEAELSDLADRLRDELERLTLDEAGIEALEQAADAAATVYRQAADTLSQQRRETADRLSQQITEVMQSLGMEGGRFEIDIDRLEDPSSWGRHGSDRIRFLVSANPGQPPRPLNKVASGGELSRISLAIQVILSRSSTIPTLIFDEVDSGIGGGIAEIVGRLLRQLGEQRQVLCVTHLPQVAAQAHQHYRVSKDKGEAGTRTRLQRLQPHARVEEIARMLGGIEISEQSLAHAREMIDSAGGDNARPAKRA